MKIIIVGAGRIGTNLSTVLSAEGHDIFLVEKNELLAHKAEEKVDGKVICGNGVDPQTLTRANVNQADLVIAVTLSDETNLAVCSLADYFGAKKKIARIRNTELSQKIQQSGYKHFHLDAIINPELVAAQAIEKTIQAPGAREVGDFVEGRILLRAFDIPRESPLCRMMIQDFKEEDFPWPFLITAINRKKEIFIPKGDTRIDPGDRIYALLPLESLGEFLTFVNPEIVKPKKVIIYGATIIGGYLVHALSDDVKDIILLEENAAKADQAASQLSQGKVINGSASEQEVLRECGIEAADYFIATTENDHLNLISAVLAKKMGVKTTIIVAQHADYAPIIEQLEIDVIINPRLLAVEQILSSVRGKGIHSVTKLMEGDAEALEFIAEPGAPITRAQLKDISFPPNSIVGAVFRGDEVILAKGNTQIQDNEKAIVFCQHTAVKKLQALFTRKKFF